MRALRFLLESRSLAPFLRTQQLRQLSLCCRALRPFEDQITALRPRVVHEPTLPAWRIKLRLNVEGWTEALRRERKGDACVTASSLSQRAMRLHTARQERAERGWDAFLDALCAGQLPQLEELDFSVACADIFCRATLGTAPALRLAQGLQFLPTLRVLNLKGCPLGSAGGVALAEGLRFTPPRLQMLSLLRTWISDEGMLALASVLPKLPELQHLDVGNCRFHYAALSTLATQLNHLPQLRFLDVSGCAGHQRALSAAYHDILHALRHLPRLETFLINGNHLRDAGAIVLADTLRCLPSLRELFLYQNKIGDEGIQALTVMLPFVPRLQRLHVGENVFSGASFAELQVAAARQGLIVSAYENDTTKTFDCPRGPCCSGVIERGGQFVSKDGIVSREECCRGRYM